MADEKPRPKNVTIMAKALKCIVVDDDPMTRKIIESLIDRTERLEKVGTFDSAIQASNFLQTDHVDLIFLDVEMPEMTGLEFVRSLQRRPSIVLVGSQEKYAVPAFDLEVTDYLLKPLDYPRFLKAVNRVKDLEAPVEMGKEPITNEKLFVKVDNYLVGINLQDVIMVEAMADYVRILVGDKRYTVYSSMKGLSAKLPEQLFMRVHRSYIVNLNKIDRIDDNTLVLNGHLVPVGVTYQKELMARINVL
jgi:two-component system LytT family response regulator